MPLLSRNPHQTGRTFQEVMEQQAARQAGFAADIIPLKRFTSASPSTDTTEYHQSPHRPTGGATHPSIQSQQYHHPTRPPTLAGRSTSHIASSSSFDQPRTSISSSNGSSRKGSTSTPKISPPSASSAGSGLPNSLAPVSPIRYPSWSNSDWGNPDLPSSPLAREQPEVEEVRGGVKGWFKKRKEKKANKKGKEKKETGEAKEKKEQPVFIGGGRGGAQNHRVRSTPAQIPNLGPIPESPAGVSRTESAPLPAGPFTIFTADVQEALEILSPKSKPVFVGGGRGGMQNRKIKDTLLPSGATGSWRSGSGRTGTASGSRSLSDESSTRRSIISMRSSTMSSSDRSGVEAAHGGPKPVFVGGGRGGVQNRRPKDMAASLSKKKRGAGLGTGDLLTGIGVSSYTVTSSATGESLKA